MSGSRSYKTRRFFRIEPVFAFSQLRRSYQVKKKDRPPLARPDCGEKGCSGIRPFSGGQKRDPPPLPQEERPEEPPEEWEEPPEEWEEPPEEWEDPQEEHEDPPEMPGIRS